MKKLKFVKMFNLTSVINDLVDSIYLYNFSLNLISYILVFFNSGNFGYYKTIYLQ